MRIYWIDSLEMGQLGMMARPRGNDWLEEEMITLKKHGVKILVSLLEPEEEAELDIEKEGFYAQKHELEFIQFSIVDRSVPNNETAFLKLVAQLLNELKKEAKIVVHCRMGIGRTGMLIAALLVQLGLHVEEAFELMSKQRGLSMPDTKEQRDWVANLNLD